MKKLVSLFLALALVMGFSAVSEAKSSTSGSFSGGVKSSISSGSTYKGDSTSQSGSGVYSSGQKSPSSNVTQKPSTPQPYQQPYQQPKSSWFGGGLGHFLGGMAAGALMSSLFGHMLHPFGGFGYGFSFWGLLFDLLLLFVGYKLIRRLFVR
ncbi:hypothetical protein [Effusibacillus pohliae]|uniref:hypothetical protein n=1 Tax=Effusibacillus pohliae TaxID=232270 RepID=UPI00037397BE|nr:hypothetical protein [Effusibacillus pohliae]